MFISLVGVAGLELFNLKCMVLVEILGTIARGGSYHGGGMNPLGWVIVVKASLLLLNPAHTVLGCLK